MDLAFKTIPKQPKDKTAVYRLKNGVIVGYIDYSPEFNKYLFKSEFDKTFHTEELSQIANKITELNQTIKK